MTTQNIHPSPNYVTEAPPVWRSWLASIAIVTMPLSINLERLIGTLKRPVYVSPLDALLPILALLMVIDLLRSKPWARFKAPPYATLLWAGLALVSCMWIANFPKGETLGDWAQAMANPLWVVMLSAWVFSNLSNDPAEYRKLTLLLLSSFGVCVLIALIQYFGPVGLPFNPDDPKRALNGVSNLRLGGWYDNRMIFGAQAAMLLPAAAAFATSDKSIPVRILCALLAVAALIVTLAAGALLGALAGIIAVAAACAISGNYSRGLSILAATMIVLTVILPKLPQQRDHAATLTRGLTFFAETGPDEKKPTARLRRYQAALDFISAHRDPADPKTPFNWINGAGAGRYNNQVNNFYDPKYYPKPGGRTDDEAKFDMETHERDGFGLIEKIGVELGVVGLAVLAFFFATWIFSATSAFTSDNTDNRRILALAALGAGVGAAVLSIFAFPAQRGAGSGGTFAFFYALSVWLARKVPPLDS